MIVPFNFSRLPLIYFGAGKINELPAALRTYGKRVLLVTGRSSLSNNPAAGRILGKLKDDGLKYHVFNVAVEPTPEIIDEAVSLNSYEKPDVIVSIGGGSVIDAGKAISAMIPSGGGITDYLEGVGTKVHPGSKVPFIAVPTTSGTGSEATKNAVISRTGPEGFKKSLRHDNLVPDIAIVDPELAVSCPGEITASSGMDCFTQLTEAYLSTRSNPYTDVLALEGIRILKDSLPAVYRDGGNLKARTGMALAALSSGICLANAGLGAVHGFASSIGGLLDIPHGVVCGTLMAAANEINVRVLRRKSSAEDPYYRKYSILGSIFSGNASMPYDHNVDKFISYLYWLTEELQLPRLSYYGLDEPSLSSVCNITDIKNNPVHLTKDDLREILMKRL